MKRCSFHRGCRLYCIQVSSGSVPYSAISRLCSTHVTQTQLKYPYVFLLLNQRLAAQQSFFVPENTKLYPLSHTRELSDS